MSKELYEIRVFSDANTTFCHAKGKEKPRSQHNSCKSVTNKQIERHIRNLGHAVCSYTRLPLFCDRNPCYTVFIYY